MSSHMVSHQETRWVCVASRRCQDFLITIPNFESRSLMLLANAFELNQVRIICLGCIQHSAENYILLVLNVAS